MGIAERLFSSAPAWFRLRASTPRRQTEMPLKGVAGLPVLDSVIEFPHQVGGIHGYRAVDHFLERLSLTAARMRSLNADSSILSPLRMSIARRTVPGCVKSPAGSASEAPLKKVSFTVVL